MPTGSRVRRPRLHRVYYLLAAFDLVAVLLSVIVIDMIMRTYAESVAENAVWAARMQKFAQLIPLAANVNAPGNDVFRAEADVSDEEARLAAARASFDAAVAELRVDLEENVLTVRPELARPLLSVLDLVARYVDAMENHARAIFPLVANDQLGEAGGRMAEMDEAYLRATNQLRALTENVQTIQAENFEAQTRKARSLRRYELLIAVLIVPMVIGVATYGHFLAKRVREASEAMERSYRAVAESEAKLERQVEERTRELAVRHEQLRLADRLASIGTLAAGLGHDMNNVLFPVRCRLDAIDNDTLDPTLRAELDAMRQPIVYLQQLSDGLRQLAMNPDDPHSADGTTLLARWWDEVRPLFLTALPADAALEGEMPAGLPALAIAPHRLTQALFNLVVNAGEAIDRGGVVRVWAREESATTARIGVTDNGAGMSADVREQAQDPFFTTKKRELSTGLGLAVVHGVASAAGGTVDIESTPGAGTTISIVLPVDPDTSPHGAGAAETPRGACAISVADRRRATYVAALARAAGFDVRHVSDGPPAGARVWIIDDGAGAAESARDFLTANGSRHVIVLGPSSATWTELGAIAVGTQPGVGVLQRALRTAVQERTT